ncbi:MAG: anti-sigma factor [Flexilinea sp.]
MNTHEIFENWILEEKALSPEETLQLNEHFDECNSCRCLYENLKESLAFIKKAPMQKPAAGFALRWQQQMIRRTEEKEKTDRIHLILGATALIGILSISSCIVFFSPGNLINMAMQISNLLKILSANTNQFKTMFSVLKTPLLIFGFGSVILLIVNILIGTLSALTIKRIRKGA